MSGGDVRVIEDMNGRLSVCFAATVDWTLSLQVPFILYSFFVVLNMHRLIVRVELCLQLYSRAGLYLFSCVIGHW